MRAAPTGRPDRHAQRDLRQRPLDRLHRQICVHRFRPRIPRSRYVYGNEGRNLLHGPGTEVVNFSLFKNFPIKERMHFQFRFETFGLFNHPNFNNPSSTFKTASFGNITGSTGERAIQLGAKLMF